MDNTEKIKELIENQYLEFIENDKVGKTIEEYKELMRYCEEEIYRNCGIPKALLEEKEKKKKFTVFNTKYLVNPK